MDCLVTATGRMTSGFGRRSEPSMVKVVVAPVCRPRSDRLLISGAAVAVPAQASHPITSKQLRHSVSILAQRVLHLMKRSSLGVGSSLLPLYAGERCQSNHSARDKLAQSLHPK